MHFLLSLLCLAQLRLPPPQLFGSWLSALHRRLVSWRFNGLILPCPHLEEAEQPQPWSAERGAWSVERFFGRSVLLQRRAPSLPPSLRREDSLKHVGLVSNLISTSY